MFTVCISVIALLQVVGVLSYNGEPSYLIKIPRENRNDSMCRNETVKQAASDLRKGDATYCRGLLEFFDVIMDPYSDNARNTFIRTVLESVYGPVIENFTLREGFSDKERLLKTIWFNGVDSLFQRVFVKNKYGNVSRTSSFASYLYDSTGQTASSLHHSKGHKNCTNETEVSIAACFHHYEPKSIVYIDEVNPLFDFTVFSLAAMMGKLIESPRTQRNLTFVVQHPDDEGCMVPLTVVYKKYNNTPAMLYTYHDIKLIYYDYDGTDGKTNFDVCNFVLSKKDDEEYIYENYDGNDDKDDYKDDNDNPEVNTRKPGKKKIEETEIDSSKIKVHIRQKEKEDQATNPSNH